MKIAVFGAGVVGVTTAFYLARGGHEVVLADKASGVASQTSFANGGQLSYSYVDPLASPVLLKSIPRLLLGKDSSFQIGSGNSYDFATWILRFLRNCTNRREKAIIKTMLSLSKRSRSEVHHLVNSYDLKFDYQRFGKLHLYHDEREFAAAKQKAAYKKSLGVEQEILTPEQCIELEPVLANYRGSFVGGNFSGNDEYGDAHKFSHEILKLAQNKYGLKFLDKTELRQLERNSDIIRNAYTNRGVIVADMYVIAMGVHSKSILKPLGINIPVYPMQGYSITLNATNECPKCSITDARSKLVITTLGNRLRVAGVAHFNGFNKEIDPCIVEQLTDSAKKIMPGAANYENILHKWSGLRPMTPNSMPIIGQSKYKNLLINAGHGMLGWTLATGSAAEIMDLVNSNS